MNNTQMKISIKILIIYIISVTLFGCEYIYPSNNDNKVLINREASREAMKSLFYLCYLNPNEVSSTLKKISVQDREQLIIACQIIMDKLESHAISESQIAAEMRQSMDKMRNIVGVTDLELEIPISRIYIWALELANALSSQHAVWESTITYSYTSLYLSKFQIFVGTILEELARTVFSDYQNELEYKYNILIAANL